MISPPTTSAVATGTGKNSIVSITFLNNTPAIAAGRNAISTLSTRRCSAASCVSPRSICQRRARYSQHTARIAPLWMATMNAARLPGRKRTRSSTTIRWPVLEMGRNSVSPSTEPSSSAFSANIQSKGVSGRTGGARLSRDRAGASPWLQRESEQLDFGLGRLRLQPAAFDQAFVVVQLVAAVAFGVIERRVRPLDARGRNVVRLDPGVADADRHPADLREDEVLDGQPQAIERRLRARRARAVEYDDELLAAETKQLVGTAKRAADQARDQQQHFVAEQVA